MLYLTGINNKNGNTEYKVMDTCTNSPLYGGIEFIRKLVEECNLEIRNAEIKEGQLEIHKWPHRISENESLSNILLGKALPGLYAVLEYNGNTKYVLADQLKKDIKNRKIDNCVCRGNEYLSMDTMELNYNASFNKEIDKKYETFIAKAIMVGKDLRFEYSVEGEDVKLINFTGDSKDVIIPGFVTSICCGAFRGGNIYSIQLNEGLKYIGADAFQFNDIAEITIPSTVKFICLSALAWNSKLIHHLTGEIDADKVRIISKDTKIIIE